MKSKLLAGAVVGALALAALGAAAQAAPAFDVTGALRSQAADGGRIAKVTWRWHRVCYWHHGYRTCSWGHRHWRSHHRAWAGYHWGWRRGWHGTYRSW
jgi:hypothetical protein